MSMSSEIYEFDGCIFNDPFSPFNDSSTIDILQAFQEHNYNYTPLLPSSPLSPPLTTQENLDTPFEEIDQIAPTIFSSSPPSHQLQNLSLYQMGISVTSSNEALDSCHLDVKTEESQLPLYDSYYYGGSDHALTMMQRSYSSNSFQQEKPNGVLYEPKINGLIESQNLQAQSLTSPDQNFSYSHMRRVCSTGDLQSPKINQTSQRLSSSPLATESSFMDEANFKVGRYNAEERKEKIMRYRAKRTQRNFNKTIKTKKIKCLLAYIENSMHAGRPLRTTDHEYVVDLHAMTSLERFKGLHFFIDMEMKRNFGWMDFMKTMMKE
ncbi:unnamed protein product [Lactuca saligna]|uniref:CCT domain-containing protein n=1 Tax=Lactuca saligna TaxID=75948 RepID=A0AA36EAL5_LACSI|nr:unnamed protein product [Lactuca saligna]